MSRLNTIGLDSQGGIPPRLAALLPRVQKPGRYVGGEFNAIYQTWDTCDVHVCLAFPDLYDLGMSNFALQLLYDILNRQPGVLAERTYLPAPDMIAALRAAGLPLYALESFRPVAAFDLLAVSLAYEQLYTNLLELLDLAGLPLRAAARDERYPLVIAGGHGTFNPEPVADFVDACVIGEGEEVIVELAAALRVLKGQPRAVQWRALAQIPGLYVPGLYRPAPPGALYRVTPVEPTVPLPIPKRVVSTLPPTPVRQLVPNIEIAHDRAVIEIQRGCTRGCRFCQAGIITRPLRERPVDEIVESVAQIVAATGYEEVALLSLSSADYSQIGPLLTALQARFGDQHLAISLPSLRVDAFSVELAERTSGGRRTGFTFAPEAGSDMLRARINKEITTANLLEVAEAVFSRGWRTLKLYFLIGLPGETDDDITAIGELARQVLRLGERFHGRRANVHLSVNTFIPKPHTVFQWEPLVEAETLTRRQALLRESCRGRGLELAWNDYRETILEALLSRGDRALGPTVERAWQLGAHFDAWAEWRNLAAWEQAFAETGVDLDAYLYRRRDPAEPLPWDHLQSGVEKRALLRDLRRSAEGQFLADCRAQCHACGILSAYPAAWSVEWKCPPPK